jgi:TM2 domain-containing membrane protein YozV
MSAQQKGITMYKIIGADGQQYGPVGADQIRRWLTENRVRADTLVQPEGATDWIPLNSVPEFAPDLRAAPPPVATSAVPGSMASRASNKLPAGICGIVLGSLGVHKFILGYQGAGAIMLVVTFVGGILTCGLASAAMSIVGIIEGIIYLTKSDEEFVRTYVDGRKEWF